jgi:hypothetical protein
VTAPLSVRCPTCDAPPGKRCRGPSGQSTVVSHVERRRGTRHGATQPEAYRRAGQVLLRLAPSTEDALRRLASRDGTTLSATVERLVLGAT